MVSRVGLITNQRPALLSSARTRVRVRGKAIVYTSFVNVRTFNCFVVLIVDRFVHAAFAVVAARLAVVEFV